MLAAQYWATGEGGDDVVWRLGRSLLTRGSEWVSGSLPALDRVMRLRREWHELAEADLQQSTVDALAAAESARLRGQEGTARCHSLVALSLVTHRARHPQRPTSTLVTQTSTVVGPLQRDATLRALSDDSAPRVGSRLVARGGIRPTPSVVILPGPFGAFHADLVAALPPVATATVSDLHQSCPELRRRRPIPQDLWLVAALRRGRINLEDGTLDGQPIRRPSLARHVRCLRRLKIELSHHDVAVSDWGDATTMWASHLSPKGTRLVTRWHSLDLFDPWLRLIDWRGVDQVMITNFALGSLFRDLTRGTGAPPPVAVRPYLPNLAGFDQPKSADAQFTIGMVGWGRLVKDPAFALVQVGVPLGAEHGQDLIDVVRTHGRHHGRDRLRRGWRGEANRVEDRVDPVPVEVLIEDSPVCPQRQPVAVFALVEQHGQGGLRLLTVVHHCDRGAEEGLNGRRRGGQHRRLCGGQFKETAGTHGGAGGDRIDIDEHRIGAEGGQHFRVGQRAHHTRLVSSRELVTLVLRLHTGEDVQSPRLSGR